MDYYSVCPHDCPDTCGWKVEIHNGRIIKVDGDPNNPVTKGIICAKARKYPERVYDKDRILYPMKRIGTKGSGFFERITWPAAIKEITQKWNQIIINYGAEAILPYSYAGTEGIVNGGSMDRRFFNRLGATQLERTICSAAGSTGYNLVYGQAKGVSPKETYHTKLFVFWGINVLETNIHQAMIADHARKNGAKIIAIDVHRNRTAKWADEFYHILPGSDGALALGLSHVIIRNGLSDFDWCKSHSFGFEDYKKAVGAYNPDYVAALTGLLPVQIENLATLYAQNHPSLIRIGNGFQHHDNGGMNTWAVSCLPVLVGAWKEKGGGAIKGNSGYFPMNKLLLERPELSQSYPRTVNMNQLGRVLTEIEPPIYSIYVYNSNPAAVAPEQELVRKGLNREDLFTVVHEQIWTDTALLADIVLPATTHLEHADLYKSYWHNLLQWADPVIDPLGESKPNIEVFRKLAQGMGFEEACFFDTAEEIARQALNLPYWQELNVSLDRLKKERFIEVPIPELPFGEGGFLTKSGLAEIKSNKALELNLPTTLPSHVPLVEGPETATTEYPLTLISPPNHHFLNSTFANIDQLKQLAGKPFVEINPKNAIERNIHDGDLIEVYNKRGSCFLTAKITESVLSGVIVSCGIWSPKDMPGNKGINSLTSSRFSDLGHGAVFFSNLVQIRKIM